jgi:hypothetical protein
LQSHMFFQRMGSQDLDWDSDSQTSHQCETSGDTCFGGGLLRTWAPGSSQSQNLPTKPSSVWLGSPSWNEDSWIWKPPAFLNEEISSR